VGRRQDALGPTEEAIRLYRELAATNPAFLPDLAMALNNLGNYYSDVGRWQDALAPGEEATRLHRELAGTNPGFLPDLARALNNLGISYSEVGRWQDALAPTEEAARLYRELAAANPAFLPSLAGALDNLGVRYGEVGRRQDALAPTEEAIRLYQELAAANPAFLPDLAMALGNLGNRHFMLGRWQDALAPSEEAVRLYRELAAANPAFLPDLARSLNNLGTHYSNAGRRQDALAPTEEAGRLYRELAAANPAFLPSLAGTLNNLGNHYSETGRRQDAQAPAEEATRLYRELTTANPAFLPDLARTLNNLGRRYSEAGSADREEAAWHQAITESPPYAAAYLLVARAAAADAGHVAAATWLARALSMDIQDRGLIVAAHDQARRHRRPNLAVFEDNWVRHTGMPVPAWLTVESEALNSARAWVATDSYTAERDYLSAHSELLQAAADTAVAEALLSLTEDEAGRYNALREAAQQDSIDAAYRPLLLTILAREFASADPGRQRALLADRRDDLLTDIVADALRDLAQREDVQGIAARRAVALLDLARSGDAEPVFEALIQPAQFRGLLHALAMRPDASSVAPAAIVAYTVAATTAEAAAALFYLAVGVATDGDQGQVGDLIMQAHAADPAQVPAWINALAEIGQHHHGVLQLIPALTGHAEQPAPSGPLSGGT
jgi:tetratricopeptide (TPR) repeat protein